MKKNKQTEAEAALHRLAKSLKIPDQGPDENVGMAVSLVQCLCRVIVRRHCNCEAMDSAWMNHQDGCAARRLIVGVYMAALINFVDNPVMHVWAELGPMPGDTGVGPVSDYTTHYDTSQVQDLEGGG